jgi:putative hydrolase of the HAD superfamily
MQADSIAVRPPDTPRALLIDGLGTLVSLPPPAPALVEELERRFGVEVTAEQAAAALHAEISYYRAHMGEGRDGASLADLRGRCAGVLRAALPASAALERVEPPALTEALLASLRFEPFADAAAALRRARAAGLRVIVVSNWDVSLIEVLERIGLAPLLDGVVTSAAVGAAKPAAAIFAHALSLAAAGPSGALHVGDSLREDVAGALALGIRAVLVRRDGAAPALLPAGASWVPDLDRLAFDSDAITGGTLSSRR